MYDMLRSWSSTCCEGPCRTSPELGKVLKSFVKVHFEDRKAALDGKM